MPYEVSFTKHVDAQDRDEYINDCCIGGDIVVDRLLPPVRARYGDVDTGQEDWGWFIWFRKGSVRLAVDVFTDDPIAGTFRMHLTSRVTRFIVLDGIVDRPELDELRALIEAELRGWVEGPLAIQRVDQDYR